MEVHPPLGDFGEFHEGIHSGNARAKLFSRTRPVWRDPSRVKPCLVGATYGDRFAPFQVTPAGNWVIYDANVAAPGEYCSLREERIFESPKIYVTRTGQRPVAFWGGDWYASNNLFSFKARGDNPAVLYLVMALINSDLVGTYLRARLAPQVSKIFTEIKIVHLAAVPVPLVGLHLQPGDVDAARAALSPGSLPAGEDDLGNQISGRAPRDLALSLIGLSWAFSEARLEFQGAPARRMNQLVRALYNT
jgi:hypothetical protein